MSDSFASLVPTAGDVVTAQTGPLLIGGLAKFQGAIHTNDPNPALITAGLDIEDLVLSIPKAAQSRPGVTSSTSAIRDRTLHRPTRR